MSLERSLARHPFVADLTAEQLAFLVGCTSNLRLDPGKFLFREDAPADRLFLIRDGKIALESSVPGRGAVQVETLGAGEVLGWSVLFPPYRWHVDGRAVESSLVFAVDGACLRRKLAENAELGYAVTRRLLFQVHRRLERARLQQLDVYKAHV